MTGADAPWLTSEARTPLSILKKVRPDYTVPKHVPLANKCILYVNNKMLVALTFFKF